jgi:hypothetical protein
MEQRNNDSDYGPQSKRKNNNDTNTKVRHGIN